MTSYDRHATHDSPYRTGRHIPPGHEPLNSVATSAVDSRADLSNPYDDDHPNGAWPGSPAGIASPNPPYSPGLRSFSSQKKLSTDLGSGVDGDIQLQSFQDGGPPPPPIARSWGKIEQWLENNYEELYDNLCEGCTQNDINELEHDLDCTLPLDVRESLMVHDGQERPGLPTGIVFGGMLLDCEEIVEESKNWRTVNEEFLDVPTVIQHQPKYASSSSSAGPSQQPSSSMWRQELLDRQDSQPPGAVRKAYVNPAWIPLVRDWGGNCIAVDLAPGPAGKWGQVIIFGRDYDCKYVVARSWASFLAVLADDICSGKAVVDEESNELSLKAFRNADPPYFEVLRWRTDQKYGRKQPRRKGPLNRNTQSGSKSNRESPYGSPRPSEERGRSPHRFPSHGTNHHSPKTPFNPSRPLARVAEEGSNAEAAGASNDLTKEDIKEEQNEDLLGGTPGSEGRAGLGIITEQKSAGPEVEDLQKRDQSRKPSGPLDRDILGEMKNVTI